MPGVPQLKHRRHLHTLTRYLIVWETQGDAMSEDRPINEVAVDRRDETVVTQQPGYAATEQVTRDVAAERRLGLFQVTRIVWTILGILEILLGLRFMLKLIGANPNSGLP